MAIDREQTKAAIYRALEGEPEDFKNIVLDMAYENNWNPNDPAFLLLTATGQLRALLRLHPDQINQAMAEALEQTRHDWADWHSQTRAIANETRAIAHEAHSTARLVTERLADVVQLLLSEREAVAALMAQERVALAAQMQQTLLLQEQALDAKTRQVMTEGIVAQQQRVDTQVNNIVESTKTKHYAEATRSICLSALGLIALSFLLFTLAGRFSTWGQIASWNHDQLKACRAAGKNTCNIHVEPP